MPHYELQALTCYQTLEDHSTVAWVYQAMECLLSELEVINQVLAGRKAQEAVPNIQIHHLWAVVGIHIRKHPSLLQDMEENK